MHMYSASPMAAHLLMLPLPPPLHRCLRAPSAHSATQTAAPFSQPPPPPCLVRGIPRASERRGAGWDAENFDGRWGAEEVVRAAESRLCDSEDATGDGNLKGGERAGDAGGGGEVARETADGVWGAERGDSEPTATGPGRGRTAVCPSPLGSPATPERGGTGALAVARLARSGQAERSRPADRCGRDSLRRTGASQRGAAAAAGSPAPPLSSPGEPGEARAEWTEGPGPDLREASGRAKTAGGRRTHLTLTPRSLMIAGGPGRGAVAAGMPSVRWGL
jgi:hypothetical protein